MNDDVVYLHHWTEAGRYAWRHVLLGAAAWASRTDARTMIQSIQTTFQSIDNTPYIIYEISSHELGVHVSRK